MKNLHSGGFPAWGKSQFGESLLKTQEAIRAGADEIDMVINIGWIKRKNGKR